MNSYFQISLLLRPINNKAVRTYNIRYTLEGHLRCVWFRYGSHTWTAVAANISRVYSHCFAVRVRPSVELFVSLHARLTPIADERFTLTYCVIDFHPRVVYSIVQDI
jgi:hypothetical protein